MAKKDVRISINKLESTLQDNIIVVPMDGVDGVDIVIRKTLPLKDMMQFVEDVVSSCVDMAGSYTPEIKEFVIKSSILTTYANFNLPSSAEKQYALLYGTRALEQVMEHINHSQLDEIREAIDARIDHTVKMLESTVAIKTNELIHNIEVLAKQFTDMFDGISGEEIGNVMRGLSGMKNMTEEALVKAVFEAQGKTTQASDAPTTNTNVIPFPTGEEK